jgi:hypothetical protein
VQKKETRRTGPAGVVHFSVAEASNQLLLEIAERYAIVLKKLRQTHFSPRRDLLRGPFNEKDVFRSTTKYAEGR